MDRPVPLPILSESTRFSSWCMDSQKLGVCTCRTSFCPDELVMTSPTLGAFSWFRQVIIRMLQYHGWRTQVILQRREDLTCRHRFLNEVTVTGCLIRGCTHVSLLFERSVITPTARSTHYCRHCDTATSYQAAFRFRTDLYHGRSPPFFGESYLFHEEPVGLYSQTIVCASTLNQDTSWVFRELLNISYAIYKAGDPSAPLRHPRNKGYESKMYLTHTINHHHSLSDITIFTRSSQHVVLRWDVLGISIPWPKRSRARTARLQNTFLQA